MILIDLIRGEGTWTTIIEADRSFQVHLSDVMCRSFVIVASSLISAVTACLPSAAADLQTVSVSGELRVYDGDTLEVGPLILRLHEIDAPELAQTCARPDGGTWPCGKVASDRLVEILTDAALSCDALDRDAYGRIVARCAADGVDIGTTMVGEGLAWAFIEYSDDYADLEEATRQTGAGIWQAPTRAGLPCRSVGAGGGGCARRVPDQGQYQWGRAHLSYTVVGLLRSGEDECRCGGGSSATKPRRRRPDGVRRGPGREKLVRL